MIKDCKLTTFDNPFDPFDEFDSWNAFDVEKGYNCACYLARVANITEDMTQKEEALEIERAIDEIVALNPLHIFKKVSRDYEYN
jgi:hypothetical protein